MNLVTGEHVVNGLRASARFAMPGSGARQFEREFAEALQWGAVP